MGMLDIFILRLVEKMSRGDLVVLDELNVILMLCGILLPVEYASDFVALEELVGFLRSL